MAACQWVQASGAGPCLEPAKACPHACANVPQAGWGLPAEAPMAALHAGSEADSRKPTGVGGLCRPCWGLALHQTDPKAQGCPLTSPDFHACTLCLCCSWGAHHRGTDKQPIPTGPRRQPSLAHPCEAPQGQQPSSPEPREGLWAHPRWPAQGAQTGTLTLPP